MLSYLLVARGPLRASDLVNVDPHDGITDSTIDDVTARHVVGDASRGYAIGHTRFREYLLANKIGTHEQETAQSRLLDYCRSWEQRPSPYALNHLVDHL